jgi:predicted Zn finger-like uncharacterized protein
MFKVVPDQLRVSDGWVRCGQCSEVFDANLNLQADSLPMTASAEYSSGQPETATDSVDSPAVLDVQDQDPFLVVNPHALHFEPEVFLGEVKDSKSPLEEMGELSALHSVEENPVASESAVEHSFLRHTPTPSVWKNRSVRVLLSVSCLVLGAMLVLQVVIHERDRIAALFTGTKGALDAVCGVTGCTLAPLRNIETVVIDSSSFAKVRADVYRLSFALKNMAHTSIATPALELTLTDMQDQPVVRRVFTAIEFGDKSGVMAAGAELSITMPLNVKLAGSHEKITGYRLLSFYP